MIKSNYFKFFINSAVRYSKSEVFNFILFHNYWTSNLSLVICAKNPRKTSNKVSPTSGGKPRKSEMLFNYMVFPLEFSKLAGTDEVSMVVPRNYRIFENPLRTGVFTRVFCRPDASFMSTAGDLAVVRILRTDLHHFSSSFFFFFSFHPQEFFRS